MSLLPCSGQARNGQNLWLPSRDWSSGSINYHPSTVFFSVGLLHCAHQCFSVLSCNLSLFWQSNLCLKFYLFLTGFSWLLSAVWAQVMQVVGCLTHSWAPAQGKITVSCMLNVPLFLLRNVLACFLLPSVQSHFASCLAHPCLCFPAVFMCCSWDRQSLLPLKTLPDCIWGEQSDSCLLPFYIWRQNMQHMP